MNIHPTHIPDVLLIEPTVFEDERGHFFESYNAEKFRSTTSLDIHFVQDNHSKSEAGILRGLHYQIENAQDKLVRVVSGEVFDVAVDLRRSSKTFGQWVGAVLSADNKKQLFVPKGFAHGFLVLSDSADFLYKASDFYNQQAERHLRWDCPDVAIDWPIETPILNSRDAQAPTLHYCETYP